MTLLTLLAALSCSQAAVRLPSPTYEALTAEGDKDPGATPRLEGAKEEAGESYTGSGPLPFHLEVLSPVELIDQAAPRRVAPKPEASAEPPAAKEPEGKDDRPSYHFEGKRPLDGLTVYTPVRDQAGSDNSTSAPGGGLFGFLKGILKWVAIAAGIALIATLTPVGIGVGAALVAGGAYLALQK